MERHPCPFCLLHSPHAHPSFVSKWDETEFGSQVVTVAQCQATLCVPLDGGVFWRVAGLQLPCGDPARSRGAGEEGWVCVVGRQQEGAGG